MKSIKVLANGILILTLIAVSAATTSAQPKQDHNWHDRMMSEKIAFLTTELDLSPEEAQVFWPVYNQAEKARGEAQKKIMKSYFALVKALENESADGKEIDKLLDEYLAAKQAQKEVNKDDANAFRKVLPGKKVAKLYVAEEKFRRHHIRGVLRDGHGKPGAQAKR